MEFSKDQADFIKGYFPNFDDWEKYGARRNNFSYTEFPVKSMIEAAIGEAILHSLDSQFGNFEIFLEDCNGNKTSFFKARSIEELKLKLAITKDDCHSRLASRPNIPVSSKSFDWNPDIDDCLHRLEFPCFPGYSKRFSLS